MQESTKNKIFAITFIFCATTFFAQNVQVHDPVVPATAQFPSYTQNIFSIPNNNPTPSQPNIYNLDSNHQRQQQASILQEVESNSRLQEKAKNKMYADIQALRKFVSYKLPSYPADKGTAFYHQAFEKIIATDTAFSLKENIFLTENAYFANSMDRVKFEKTIAESAAFLTAKMKEQGYDPNSNLAKNYLLFQFFAERMQLKSGGQKHQPFSYDFDDPMGVQNYAKMFVTKLLETGSGQCHSLPLLYLILAEEIDAEAYLSVAPNHTYIRFPDDARKWFNIELTNAMFTTESFILQSGYIKSEALQNKIYMENLNRKQIMSRLLVDLASGYIHKFGNDEFAAKVIDRALTLDPNSISAHMVKANIDTARFEYVMKQLQINPRDKKQFQNIRQYPNAVGLLKNLNAQYTLIDNLGYEPMSLEAYQGWLQSMKEEKQKQDNEEIAARLKKILPKTKKVKG